jgi:hypothetical protein
MENADLRSWNSLPRTLQAARVEVPAGMHSFEIKLMGSGALGSVTLKDVPVREGRITIILLRSIGNLGTAKYVAF